MNLIDEILILNMLNKKKFKIKFDFQEHFLIRMIKTFLIMKIIDLQ